jgi:ribosome biogenesis SPOUT family RNA methylase Rps3
MTSSHLQGGACAPSSPSKPIIQAALALHGLRMDEEDSLDLLDGQGVVILDITSGEEVDPRGLPHDVLCLAEAWSHLSGVQV